MKRGFLPGKVGGEGILLAETAPDSCGRVGCGSRGCGFPQRREVAGQASKAGMGQRAFEAKLSCLDPGGTGEPPGDFSGKESWADTGPGRAGIGAGRRHGIEKSFGDRSRDLHTGATLLGRSRWAQSKSHNLSKPR